MPKEKVLIYENQKAQKYEVRFKKDFAYGALNSFKLSFEGLISATLLANKINNNDANTNLIISRLRSLSKDHKISEDFYPVQTTLFPRVVIRKVEFDG